MGGGSRAGKMEQHSAGKPYVRHRLCVGCGMCTRVCAHDAITIDERKAEINHDKCVGCGRCVGVCPKDAVTPEFSESNDILNCKMAEYTLAICKDRPCFHISLICDVSPNCDCHAEMIVRSFRMSVCWHPLIRWLWIWHVRICATSSRYCPTVYWQKTWSSISMNMGNVTADTDTIILFYTSGYQLEKLHRACGKDRTGYRPV